MLLEVACGLAPPTIQLRCAISPGRPGVTTPHHRLLTLLRDHAWDQHDPALSAWVYQGRHVPGDDEREARRAVAWLLSWGSDDGQQLRVTQRRGCQRTRSSTYLNCHFKRRADPPVDNLSRRS